MGGVHFHRVSRGVHIYGVDKIITAAKRLANIKKLHELSKSTFPGDRATFRPKIETQIKGMMKDGYIKFVCDVDTREQKPYTENEIGMRTVSTKLDEGDYQFTVFIEQGEQYKIKTVRLGLIIERKSINDFYSTLMVSKNCERFYREIERAKGRDFFIFVEGSEAEYLSYVIPSKRHDMRNEVLKTNAARRGKLASLEARGAHVCFKSSRLNCCLDLSKYAEQWLLKHYVEVFEL